MGGSGQRMGGSGQRVKKWAKNALCGQRCNFVGQRKINDPAWPPLRIITRSPSPAAASARTSCAATVKPPPRSAARASRSTWPRPATSRRFAPSPPSAVPLPFYGLLTREENVLFTSQPGVPDRLVGTINEPPAAAAARSSALLSDLLT